MPVKCALAPIQSPRVGRSAQLAGEARPSIAHQRPQATISDRALRTLPSALSISQAPAGLLPDAGARTLRTASPSCDSTPADSAALQSSWSRQRLESPNAGRGKSKVRDTPRWVTN